MTGEQGDHGERGGGEGWSLGMPIAGQLMVGGGGGVGGGGTSLSGIKTNGLRHTVQRWYSQTLLGQSENAGKMKFSVPEEHYESSGMST
jgi:hypothetical protein